LRPERLLLLAVAVLSAEGALAAFDANGVTLGASEEVVKQHFPNAHCQPLQWETRAADRRCDDSRTTLAGVEARITVYLKNDAVEAFDVRFESRDAERFTKLVSKSLGASPVARDTEKAHTLSWRKNGERALLSMQDGQRRATLVVWRGAFYDEIYKVR
jgi:hypothetical protein